MKTPIALCVLALSMVACGSDRVATPIASTPLAGSVGGRPFTAKSALAKKASSSADKKSVTIYDVDAKCGSTPATDRWVFATPVWREGAEQSQYSAAFYVAGTGGEPGLLSIADEATMEVVKAPTTKGSVGILRLRARVKAETVEGQVDVQICD